MYICQSQSPNSSHLPFPLGVHTFVLYICDSISALQISSSVSFFYIPHVSDIIRYLFWEDTFLQFEATQVVVIYYSSLRKLTQLLESGSRKWMKKGPGKRGRDVHTISQNSGAFLSTCSWTLAFLMVVTLPICSQPANGNNNSTYLTGLLSGLNEFISVKVPEEHLAQNLYYFSIGFYFTYCYCCYLLFLLFLFAGIYMPWLSQSLFE